ncbi:MAG: hypothetical protein MTP17_03230 [Candidatus Midichloria sp.]|nr:MAG: hypothetical protein MTP17_03230 [Candidatus Midichloria sp.]
MHKTLDIYTDYLICQNSYATTTGLSDLLCGEMGHNKFTRFFNGTALGSQDLWGYIKPEVRKNEKKLGRILILDDSIEERPYTNENEIMCWHYSHAKGRHVKRINILSCLVGAVTLPVSYKIVHKEIVFYDTESKKVKKKASMTRNEHFRNLIKQSHINTNSQGVKEKEN